MSEIALNTNDGSVTTPNAPDLPPNQIAQFDTGLPPNIFNDALDLGDAITDSSLIRELGEERDHEHQHFGVREVRDQRATIGAGDLAAAQPILQIIASAPGADGEPDEIRRAAIADYFERNRVRRDQRGEPRRDETAMQKHPRRRPEPGGHSRLGPTAQTAGDAEHHVRTKFV